MKKPVIKITANLESNAQPGKTSRSKAGASGGSIKKKSGSIKKKAEEVSRKISHSYCEAVVYDDDTEEGFHLGVPDKIIPGGARARSTSMFETRGEGSAAQRSIPEDYMEEEGEVGKREETGRGEEKAGMTLNEALMKMGGDCPYKDLI